MQQFPGSTVIDMRSLLRTAPSDLARVFRQCGQQTAIRKLAVVASSTEGSLLCPLFYSFLGFFFFLAQLHKHIEIHTSEGSGQQVLPLQPCHEPDSSLPLHAIPARTPLQWGGNWTDHTLFTHFATEMKWAVPKHTVTDSGGRRSLFHQRHVF